jgi:hypothetical protein
MASRTVGVGVVRCTGFGFTQIDVVPPDLQHLNRARFGPGENYASVYRNAERVDEGHYAVPPG